MCAQCFRNCARIGDGECFGLLNRSDMPNTSNIIDNNAAHERADDAEWLIEQFKAVDNNTLTSIQFEAFMTLMIENADTPFLKATFEEYQRRKVFQVAVSTAS